MSMYHTNTDERDAMTTLRSLGIATVVVHFSGGNDSGGADSIEALTTDGTAVPIPDSPAHTDMEWNPVTRQWRDVGWVVWDYSTTPATKRTATADEIRWAKVTTVLEAPIYAQWGTFAGEFEVYGTCTWNVSDGTHKLAGQESVSSWRDF